MDDPFYFTRYQAGVAVSICVLFMLIVSTFFVATLVRNLPVVNNRPSDKTLQVMSLAFGALILALTYLLVTLAVHLVNSLG